MFQLNALNNTRHYSLFTATCFGLTMAFSESTYQVSCSVDRASWYDPCQ